MNDENRELKHRVKEAVAALDLDHMSGLGPFNGLMRRNIRRQTRKHAWRARFACCPTMASALNAWTGSFQKARYSTRNGGQWKVSSWQCSLWHCPWCGDKAPEGEHLQLDATGPFCCKAFTDAANRKSETDRVRMEYSFYGYYDTWTWSLIGKVCPTFYCPWCGTNLPSKPSINPRLFL